MTRRGLAGTGVAVAAVILLGDQLSKMFFLDLVAQHSPPVIYVAPFFNLVQVWNTGVSFGLFQEDSAVRSWTLVGVAAAVLVWLSIWLWRAHNRLVAVALGGIIGGAIGNIIDRLRFGAVFDFVDLHAFGWHWPAFNLADSAIVVGVGLLLLDGLRPSRDA
ncbi:MAG TPA: signal peptidase II [Ferrovibrio sp.]|jgi:signal peptidase II|uniref:signal peptidase II n=1 Tax=Ferrovibrio sp. TaxID=1917215 RepID=UPI002B4B9214|nr:signal peptidase II [Ferrovibrio sp.]HLT76711.1 signal peptidase II [Ferrovibrio sp.]